MIKFKKLILVIFTYFSILTLSYCFYELEQMRAEYKQEQVKPNFITYKNSTHEQEKN
jgi:hypothetical protein